jgi:hypothetical protein
MMLIWHFLVNYDNNGIDEITPEFTILCNLQKRFVKSLANDELIITLFISGTEEMKIFEIVFGFTHKDGDIEKISSDFYTICDSFITNGNYGIYLCHSNLTYYQFVMEINNLEMIDKICMDISDELYH